MEEVQTKQPEDLQTFESAVIERAAESIIENEKQFIAESPLNPDKPKETTGISKIIIPNAAEYERIGRRAKIANTEETRQLLLDDTYKGIERALDQDGSTGKLSNPDGITKGEAIKYRGFFLQCYGYVTYENELDIFGKMTWYGFARLEKMVKGEKVTIQFDAFRHPSEHSAGHELYTLIDAFYGNKGN